MADNELSIKLTIAGRVYPLTINREDEEMMRKSANKINDRIREYEKMYSVRDEQDLLAMCALEYVNQFLSGGSASSEDDALMQRIATLNDHVAAYLDQK